MTAPTDGPWEISHLGKDGAWEIRVEGFVICSRNRIDHLSLQSAANAKLIAAAPDLLAAAKLLEVAETAHVNCPECEGEEVPELCPRCFPAFEEARIARRTAIAKATKG